MALPVQFANGNHANGDAPPPSTLAAQIVRNQIRPVASHHNDQQALFASLLNEILHNSAADVETDLETNVQLIKVLVQAGLTVLIHDHPFAEDVLIQQARDSVSVIEATIKRQPEVLVVPISPDGPQVCLWLLARLAAIIGKPNCQSVPTAQLLGHALDALGNPATLWRPASLMREIIEESVHDVIIALESFNPTIGFDVRIPPARCLGKLWPQAEGAIVASQDCQTQAQNPAHACMLAARICSLTCMNSTWRAEECMRLSKVTPRMRRVLKDSKLWDASIQHMLGNFPAGSRSRLLNDVMETLLTDTALTSQSQLAIAQALLEIPTDSTFAALDMLMPTTILLANSAVFPNLSDDLRTAIALWLSRFPSQTNELPESIRLLQDAFRQGDLITDSEMPTAFRRSDDDTCSSKPMRCFRKRRKLDKPDLDKERRLSVHKAGKLLIDRETDNPSSLLDFTPGTYDGLRDSQQCDVWRSLAKLARFEPSVVTRLTATLLKSPAMQSNTTAKVLAMLAIRVCAEATSDPAVLDLSISTIGKACLRALQSSSRQLRIAAGNSLPAFLRCPQNTSIETSNRHTVLQWLRNLSDQKAPGLQETLIPAWGLVTRSCDEVELNLVLLRLIDYLGSSNSYTRALAFTEIQNIANYLHPSGDVETLLTPYWSSIAVSAVQELPLRPQKTQMLCDLIGKDVNTFLNLTQKFTVPSLVATKRRDALVRVAAARSPTASVRDICIQPRANRSAILSHLLSQSGPDIEEYAMECLTAVDSSFSSENLADYVKIDPTAVACDLLKHAGDQDAESKPRAYHSFFILASLCVRSSGQRKAQSKSTRIMTDFLRHQILGILTGFSSVIAAPVETKSFREKTRCLKATAEMITLAREEVSVALPQIRALLESAIEQPRLCESAWSAWLTLIPVLGGDDLALIIEQTFALIIKHWETFSEELQQCTHSAIAEIVKRHNAVIHQCVAVLPTLSGIPVFAKIAGEIERLQAGETIEGRYKALSQRLRDENTTVVLQALRELLSFLKVHQGTIHDTAVSEQPGQYLSDLVRSLLDASVRLAHISDEAAELCGKALGLVGCLDPNRIDATRKREHVLVLSDFEIADDVVQWAVVLLEDYLVKAFKSVTNAQAQGFMAYVIQELLTACEFESEHVLRPRASQTSRSARWASMPEHVRATLTPFLSSKYTVTTSASFNPPKRAYPGFSPDSSHSAWLRTLVYDLTGKANGRNANMLFQHLARIVRGHDLSIANFLLPYIVMNIVLGGTFGQTNDIRSEMLAVLQSPYDNSTQFENVRLCSESLFGVLDYMSIWLQEKRKIFTETRANAFRTGQSPGDFDEIKDAGQIKTVDDFLEAIPAEIIAKRAMECGSFPRALFNWEQFVRQSRPLIPSGSITADEEELYDRLHEIYAQIDEPDGLEGISTHLAFLSEEQQATLHARSGRWTAAQAWYESKLADDSNNEELQGALLHCLQQTGRHSTLMKYADTFIAGATKSSSSALQNTALPAAVEAAYMANDVSSLKRFISRTENGFSDDFNVGIGRIIIAGLEDQWEELSQHVSTLRSDIVLGMTAASTSSLQTSHVDLKRLHVLSEVEIMSNASRSNQMSPALYSILDKRLDLLGSYVSDKQSILAIRRAFLRPDVDEFSNRYMASSWLTTARLARKAGNSESAYNAVLQASEAGDKAAKLEEARLLWHDGHKRQAISAVEQTVAARIFDEDGESQAGKNVSSSIHGHKQNMLSAKAHLLLAKWLDASGQTQTKEMTEKYQYAAKTFQKWEKGHYHLGKHYHRLLEAEKALPKTKQTSLLICGELTRLVIENLLRSVPFGNKYWHETIPKILTLWLDLGMETQSRGSREDREAFDKRTKALQSVHKQLRKYFDRIPPYIFYSALPQMLSRISHPHPDVWKELSHIITKIVATHPSQGLWSLMAVTKATDKTRQERARDIINKLKSPDTKVRSDGAVDLRLLITAGQRLSDGLLQASEAPVESRATNVSLSKDLHFNLKLAPCNLVVPIETTLTINLPPAADSLRIRSHKPFVQEKITIQSFQDNVAVLTSLQRPKKLILRGSDGKSYGLLCKPKDDLRKDQRLMEFNGIINRALKRDAEGSKRRLYIKTYAVTPLSEESGCLEWVEGIKPIRDILLNFYMRKGIKPNYTEIKTHLNEACKSPDNMHIYTDKVQAVFPPALHEWFTEVYPEPDMWFASRLRYARSAAVMSMTGHVLGLGDRHGENILLQESTGGVFHVDFNCLFDKGMTFEKPEVVPFRLTPNMVDAMGPYGYEGPFRRSCEVTLGLLRQNKDTLMTILETFLYDPTTDFVGKKKRTTPGVPETPREILDSVEAKLTGLLREETVPLSVEGYVDALIREAVSPWNLCQMYIGWCAFL